MTAVIVATAATIALGLFASRLRIEPKPDPGPTVAGLESAAASCRGVVLARTSSPRVGVVVVHVWGGKSGDVEDIVGKIRPAGFTYQVRVHRVTPGAVLAAAIGWGQRVRLS